VQVAEGMGLKDNLLQAKYLIYNNFFETKKENRSGPS
jgi:hypothetical protein